jgi:hypothetical protein
MKRLLSILTLAMFAGMANAQTNKGWFGAATASVGPTWTCWTLLPILQAGTVIKLRAFIQATNNTASTLRLALYDPSGTLLCAGSNTIDSLGFVEVNVTPTAVAAVTNRIAITTSGAVDIWMGSSNAVLGTNLFFYWATNAYAIFPPATLPAAAGTNMFAPGLGAYIQ